MLLLLGANEFIFNICNDIPLLLLGNRTVLHGILYTTDKLRHLIDITVRLALSISFSF